MYCVCDEFEKVLDMTSLQSIFLKYKSTDCEISLTVTLFPPFPPYFCCLLKKLLKMQWKVEMFKIKLYCSQNSINSNFISSHIKYKFPHSSTYNLPLTPAQITLSISL